MSDSPETADRQSRSPIPGTWLRPELPNEPITEVDLASERQENTPDPSPPECLPNEPISLLAPPGQPCQSRHRQTTYSHLTPLPGRPLHPASQSSNPDPLPLAQSPGPDPRLWLALPWLRDTPPCRGETLIPHSTPNPQPQRHAEAN